MRLKQGAFGDAAIWIGTEGDDLFIGTNENDVAQGLGGADRLFGGNGADSLFGGAGGDIVHGGAGNDFIDGGADNDTLYGDSDRIHPFGDDTVRGGAGNDRLFGGGGQDVLDGGANDDVVYGQDGDDSLSIDSGMDSLFGGSGDDVIGDIFSVAPLTTGDLFDGGEGYDRFIWHRGPEPLPNGQPLSEIVIDLEKGVIATSQGTGSLANFEAVTAIGSNYAIYGGDIGETVRVESTTTDPARGSKIYGNGGDDILTSTSSFDSLFGGDGKDMLFGGGGADSLYGGAGNDFLDGGDGNDFVDAGEGDDTYQDFGLGDDTVYGGSGVDEFILNGAIEDFEVQDLGDGRFIVTNVHTGEVDHYYEFERYFPGVMS